MKVLVIQQRMGMGDMVIFLPYIHAISNKFRSKISLLVKENSRAKHLCEHDPYIEEIIHLERNKNKNGKHDGFFGFLRLIRELKEKKFDKVFIFNGSLRYWLIAKFCGIKYIYKYPFFTKNDNIVATAKKFTEKNISEKISSQSKLFLSTKNIETAKKNYNFDKKFKHICIGISASGPTRRWDIENFINLAKKLSEVKLCKFYLCGGKDDENLFNKFFNSNLKENCIFFKDFEIRDTLPIIANCDFYVGNDTGWMHIAAALGLKSIGLFADTPVLAYGKYTKNILPILAEGETEQSTKHNTLGKDRINFQKVLDRSIELIN